LTRTVCAVDTSSQQGLTNKQQTTTSY